MAQLPPRVPNWPPAFPPHNRMPSLTTNSQFPPPHPPSWVDEFLDFTSARRGNHRRSVSDSIAFLEAPLLDECVRGTSAAAAFDKLDDDQLLSMFSDDIPGGSDTVPRPAGGSNSSTPSSHSDQNSGNEDKQNSADLAEPPPAKAEHGEAESSCNPDSAADPIPDTKRVKRIIANRQSAQRSRVRKLQYISELERSVTTLQTEVSALSPRVAFLDHQRLILNVDNSAIKQRIAALAQDKIFKDGH
ncbi:hypothetical protein V2J09_017124 [Rumex salicifolius]